MSQMFTNLERYGQWKTIYVCETVNSLTPERLAELLFHARRLLVLIYCILLTGRFTNSWGVFTNLMFQLTVTYSTPIKLFELDLNLIDWFIDFSQY